MHVKIAQHGKHVTSPRAHVTHNVVCSNRSTTIQSYVFSARDRGQTACHRKILHRQTKQEKENEGNIFNERMSGSVAPYQVFTW